MARFSLVGLALLGLSCNHDDGITRHNAAPSATITAPESGSQHPEGYAVALRGLVSDPDLQDALVVTWRVGDEVICGPQGPAEDGVTECSVSLPVGAATITLEVTDPENAAASDQIELSIVEGGTPTVDITEPTGGTYRTDDLLSFVAEVDDVEDEETALEVWWESSLSGRLDWVSAPTATGAVTASGYLPAGDHEISLHVRDTTGKIGRDQVVLTVLPANRAPTCEITAPIDGSVGAPGEEVVFVGVVSDADQSANRLTVSWASDTGGSWGQVVPNSAGEVRYSTASLAEATHRVTLTAVDDEGVSCSDDVLFTVGSPPMVSLETPSSVVLLGQTVTLSGTVTDADHPYSALEVRWISSIDGLFAENTPDDLGALRVNYAGLSRGTHLLSVEVEDPDGFYARDQATVRVNGAPTAPVVTLPAAPTTESALIAQLSAPGVDPDGDPIHYTYAWLRDGTPVAGQDDADIAASLTHKGENWRVEVTAWDDWARGGTGVAETRVLNTLPSAPVVQLEPVAPVSGVDGLRCRVMTPSVDPDLDVLSYALSWTAEDAPRTADGRDILENDTIFAENTVAREVWRCTARASDGEGQSAASFAEVAIRGELVDWAALETCSLSRVASSFATLEAWVFHIAPDGSAVTQGIGQGLGLSVEVGYGPDGSLPGDGSGWTWFPATYLRDADGLSWGDHANDVYQGELRAPSVTGVFDLAARASTDGGLSWRYADLGHLCDGRDGTRDGYAPADAGHLAVTAH